MFSALYVWGISREKIAVNPVKAFKRAKDFEGITAGVIRWMDTKEEERVRTLLRKDVEACDPEKQPRLHQHRLHRIYEFTIALGTCVRQGEQFRMTWDDVNFDRPDVFLAKTKHGAARNVYLIGDVVHAMRELQKMPLPRRQRRRGELNKSPANSVFSLGSPKKWFASALRRAKVNNFRWYDLRHTFISRLVQRNVNLRGVQEAAGHKNIATTALYAHLNQTNVQNAMDLLNTGLAKSAIS